MVDADPLLLATDLVDVEAPTTVFVSSVCLLMYCTLHSSVADHTVVKVCPIISNNQVQLTK